MGRLDEGASTPTGLWQAHDTGSRNPFRVGENLSAFSHGSSFLATLGCGVESLWDSVLRRGASARAVLLGALLCGCLPTLAHAQVAAPLFTPPSGTRLPVTVTITNATAGSDIYFTLDGTVPDTNATLYTEPLSFTNYTAIRARAFATGQTPSEPVSANYLTWDDPPPVSYQRIVTNDLPDLPLVTVQITGASNVACFTIEERMPAMIQAANITGDAVWNPTNQTIRWGPYTNTPAVTVTYRVTGMPGTHQVDGAASVDGAWWFIPSPSPVTITPPGGGGGTPSMPPQVATPTFSPASGTNVPVDVTISCATPGAVTYYTLDGSLPTTSSMLYTGVVHLVEACVVRARAFTNGWTASVASVAFYGPPLPPLDLQVQRTLNTNVPTAPMLTLTATAGTNASCFAFEEWLPLGLTASNVTADGVFSASNRVVRWGPFFGTNAVALSYQAVGQPGSYPVRATWSVDGVSGGEAQGTNVVIASAGGGGGIPTPPSQLPAPVLSPAIGTNLPVTVSISCTDTLAEIRYTLDGSVPTQGSSLYTSALVFSTPTTLRARAFRTGYLPSVAVVGNYVAAPDSSLDLVRAVSGNGTFLPAISITATPHGNLQCYAVTETVASGLTPYDLGQDAVWNETNRTIRWGPYTDASSRVLTYRMSGPSAAYALAGQGSFDGNAATISGATALTVDLNTMPTVATPAIAPTPNGIFPVNVIISCVTTGAVIHYTLDGSTPDEASPVYAGPIHLDTITLVRARAFRVWSVPSGIVQLLYGDEQRAAGTTVGRTITGSGTASPLVQIAVQPGAAVECYAVTEVLPGVLTPQQITDNGVFNEATRTIRWGPFLDAQARTVAYRLSGPDGSYELSGDGSFDGFGTNTPGDYLVVLDNHAYLSHGAVSNWSFAVSVLVTSTPPVGASCYAVEEFLPAGLTPQNISDGGLWNSNTLTIKWGPFLDDAPRTLSYDPIGAFTSYSPSGVISVDGVSHSWGGDITVATGLPAPQNVSAIPGNRAIYVFWEGNGQEAGFRLYYWTATNHSDESSVNLSRGEDFCALSGLQNGTNYFLAMTAVDGNSVESARSVTVSARPSASAGAYGEVAFNTNYYAAVSETAVVTVWDMDLNTNASTQQTVLIQVASASDTNGFWLRLRETGVDTGIFSSDANGTNLTFTFAPSDPVLRQLQVAEGDSVWAVYSDALPAGQRVDVAQFMQYDSDGNGVPDWWERVHFGGLGIITPISDSDADGMRDMDEYQAGTDPLDPESVLKFVHIERLAGGEVLLSWTSVAGKMYDIEKANSLESSFYTLIWSIPGAPPLNSYVDVVTPGEEKVFYRVRVW